MWGKGWDIRAFGPTGPGLLAEDGNGGPFTAGLAWVSSCEFFSSGPCCCLPSPLISPPPPPFRQPPSATGPGLTGGAVAVRVGAGVGRRPVAPQGGVPLTAVRGGQRQGASELGVWGSRGAQRAGAGEEPPPCCEERRLVAGIGLRPRGHSAGPVLGAGEGLPGSHRVATAPHRGPTDQASRPPAPRSLHPASAPRPPAPRSLHPALAPQTPGPQEPAPGLGPPDARPAA